jgi:hypothetical protein
LAAGGRISRARPGIPLLITSCLPMILDQISRFFHRLIPALSADGPDRARFMLDWLKRQDARKGERIQRYFTEENHGLDPTQREAIDQSLALTGDPVAAKRELLNDELLAHTFGIPSWRLKGVRQGFMQVMAEKEFGAKGPVDDEGFFDMAKRRFLQQPAVAEPDGLDPGTRTDLEALDREHERMLRRRMNGPQALAVWEAYREARTNIVNGAKARQEALAAAPPPSGRILVPAPIPEYRRNPRSAQ